MTRLALLATMGNVQRFCFRFFFLLVLIFPQLAPAAGRARHVVVLVWDGMRPDFVTPEHAPTLHRLAQEGVFFQNHHAVYCSATEVNGTALATGACPEHSGVIANRDYRPEIDPLRPVDTQSLSVIRKGDELSGGHYLQRPTLAEILQAAGRSTIIAGTKPVVLLHDRRERPDGATNITLYEGKTLPASAVVPIRQLLGPFPPDVSSRSNTPNAPRNQWTQRALTGSLWSNGVPAFSLLWLSEPDFSQHAKGPGSPQALSAIENSDQRLADVLAELDKRGVRDRTDVLVVSDHGFSTVQKSVDVRRALTNAGFTAAREFKSPPKNNDIVVAGQGGSVLFYVVGRAPEMIRKLVDFLQQQEFAGALFTREPMEGTFALRDAKVESAHAPDVLMSMRWSDRTSDTGARGLFISDGSARPGAGNHASLSRFDLNNILIAAGPDFKKGLKNELPSGNIDLAPTILWLLDVKPTQPMDGRVLSEAMSVDGPPPAGAAVTRELKSSRQLEQGVWRQYLKISRVNDTVYIDEGNAEIAPK